MEKPEILLRKALVPAFYYQWWEKAPKTIGTREINWDHILYHIPAERKVEAGKIVTENLDLFEDGDHQVVFVENILRFKEVAYYSTMGTGHLDLNRVKLDTELGKIPKSHFNQLMRDIGCSLLGYRDVWYPQNRELEFHKNLLFSEGEFRKEPDYLLDSEGFYVLEFNLESSVAKVLPEKKKGQTKSEETVTLFGRIRDSDGLRIDCIPVDISRMSSYSDLYNILDDILQPEGRLEIFHVVSDSTTGGVITYPDGVCVVPLVDDKSLSMVSSGDFIEIKLLPPNLNS